MGSQNKPKGPSTGTRAPTLTQHVSKMDTNLLQDTPKRLKSFKLTTTQLPNLKKQKFKKKGGAPFCPKARLAAVAQQNHYKPYKRKFEKWTAPPSARRLG